MRETLAPGVTTPRDRLNRLIAEGQRGVEVATVGLGNPRELTKMRIMPDCHARDRSISQGSLEGGGRHPLGPSHATVGQHGRLDGDSDAVRRWGQDDRKFHRATLAACNMPALMESCANRFGCYIH